MTEAERDPCWDAMVTFADRINGSDRVQELEVVVYRHLVLHRLVYLSKDSGSAIPGPTCTNPFVGVPGSEVRTARSSPWSRRRPTSVASFACDRTSAGTSRTRMVGERQAARAPLRRDRSVTLRTGIGGHGRGRDGPQQHR